MAHRMKTQILLTGNLDPVFAGLADGAFAVLPISLGRLHSHYYTVLRPLCHGVSVTAGGSYSSCAPGS